MKKSRMPLKDILEMDVRAMKAGEGLMKQQLGADVYRALLHEKTWILKRLREDA